MQNQSKNINILIPYNVPSAFTYMAPDSMELEVGELVRVPFGKKTVAGVVWEDAKTEIATSRLKTILEKIPQIKLRPKLVEFVNWVANYTMSSPGMVLKMVLVNEENLESEDMEMIYRSFSLEGEGRDEGGRALGLSSGVSNKVSSPHPSPLPGGEGIKTLKELKEKTGYSQAKIKKMLASGEIIKEHKPVNYYPEEIQKNSFPLSDIQESAAEQLKEYIKANEYSAIVLDGVTGSGKTEVYLTAIDEVFKDDTAQVLIMLPEIALTNQVVNRFERRFGFAPLMWHSAVGKSAKTKTWRKVMYGGTRLVIGARSSLFLPFKNLKLIIVDEEHDSSYKQEEGVIYNARDMAVLRAKIEEIPVILASATPSIETLENAKSGKYKWLHLPDRHGGAVMPDVNIIDMRKEKLDAKHFISKPLIDAIASNIANKKQSLLFLNRRGYAPLVLCRNCGHRFQCKECSTWLVQHKHGARLMCHHCGFAMPEPKNCPECGKEDSLVSCGPGVERVEEEVREYFPHAKIALMASDSLTHARMEALLSNIISGDIDVIIGTQVIAKGHHFPKLNLVGVVDSDLGLEGGDLRAAERTYQTLHQVAGRAGREGGQGTVMLQSYIPGNMVVGALKLWDRDSFITAEMESRRLHDVPPFGRFAAIIISGAKEQQVAQIAKHIAASAPRHPQISILGPVPAPIFMLRGKFRYRILVKAPRNINIQNFMNQMLGKIKIPASIKIKLDIDPYNFL